jgi:hypothetical protein
VIQEELDNCSVLEKEGNMQNCPPDSVSQIGLRRVIQEPLADVESLAGAGPVQRRYAGVVYRVHICVLFKKGLANGDLASMRCEVERGEVTKKDSEKV